MKMVGKMRRMNIGTHIDIQYIYFLFFWKIKAVVEYCAQCERWVSTGACWSERGTTRKVKPVKGHCIRS